MARALRAAHEPGKRARLAATLDAYGPAIEADLAFRGVDLAQLWNDRRWRLLLNLIDHLPRNSAYVEAQAQDEELARAYVRAGRDQQEPQVAVERVSEWSAERYALARIEDRLAELIAAVIASAGGKPGKVRYAERPKTAVDRVKIEVGIEVHRTLVTRLLPDAPRVE